MNAKTLHGFLVAHANEYEGRFPDDPAILQSDGIDIGLPKAEAQEYLTPVFDYRGRGRKTTDEPGQLLYRCHIKSVPDKEVRVTLAGSCRVVPVTDPLPQETLNSSNR